MTKISRHNCLGVVNATPNSFSDGNMYHNEDLQNHFYMQLGIVAKECEFSSVDLGAESTAPLNDPVSVDEEWNRLSHYIEKNLANLKTFATISIDTYKIEIIEMFYKNYASEFNSVLWNDVSGDYLSATNILLEYPKLKYVLSHNLAPKRCKTSFHIDYISEDVVKSVGDLFRSGLQFFEAYKINKNRIFLDPCFGFSKTKEQNYILMKSLLSDYSLINMHDRWLFGLSKKSFLQSLTIGESKGVGLQDSEYAHAAYLYQLMKVYSDKTCLFRVHNPSLFWTTKKLYEMIN